jgi:arylsulfatase A-like enzyme
MTRHCLTAILVVLGILGTVLPADERPNILFILIDDLGWMDLHCQGNSAVHTPNIDRFAEQGMRFIDAYAAAPVCSPTRAAIITGQSPARLQITNHIPDRKSFVPDNAKLLPADMLDHLPLEAETLAERLQAAGYATAFLGKWHLSGPEKPPTGFEPDRQGFDLNLGGCGLGGPPTFFDPYRIFSLPSRKPGEYLPDRLADETIAFMAENRSRPFFVALWNYTVHWPMEAPAVLLDKYAGHEGPGLNDSRYGAMIEAMDLATGRILDALKRLELESNTLVIFTSDNGGFSGVADNRPLRNGKGDLYEGGIRVPLIVRWPGRVEPGSVCRTPVVSMDFYPTLLETAGLAQRTDLLLDGESLMPLLRQSGGLDRDSLYFHYPNYAWHRSNRLGGAIRKGPYKLIERFDDGSLELFDLENDLSEKRNLAAEKPELAAELAGELRDWREEVGATMPTKSSGE